MTSSAVRPVLALLSALVEERTGLRYESRDLELFASKLASRLGVAGFESLLDYYYFLRYDGAAERELEALVEALVVTETYFFREADALVALVEHVLRPRLEAGLRPRVWSAACASGEEPLSLAMLLDERGWLERVDVVASDISLAAFRRAEGRGWGRRSIRTATPPTIGRWTHSEGERVRVDRKLIDAVEWRAINLMDAKACASVGTFDAILCRNVLIYFGDETVLSVVGRLGAALRPEGRLLLGASESLMRLGTLFECEESGGVFFYRRSRA